MLAFLLCGWSCSKEPAGHTSRNDASTTVPSDAAPVVDTVVADTVVVDAAVEPAAPDVPEMDVAGPSGDASSGEDGPAMDVRATDAPAEMRAMDAVPETRPMDAAIETRADATAPDVTTTDATGTAHPTLFYLDVGGKVMRADDAENPMPRAIVASAGQGPDGIALDLAHGYIYWTTMGVPADDDGGLRRSNLDGTNVTTIVPNGGTYTPKQMRIEPASAKLYWSDREGMRVQRANLDGSSIETLVTVATGTTGRTDASNWCVGMAVDAAGGWFYWSQKGPDNGGKGSIRRAHIAMPAGQTSTNRTDIEILFSGLPEPIDLELDVAGGMIYWADRGDDTISRAPIAIPAGSTAATRKDRQVIVTGVREAIGVAIDKARGRLYYTGASGQLGRANLDGTAKQERTGSGAMTGIVVVDL